MLKINLRNAFRNLWKHKTLSALNLGGMALGIAVCSLLLLQLRYELSFERHHSRHQRIYRLAVQDAGATNASGIAKVPGPFAGMALRDVPEVDEATRFVRYFEALVSKGPKRFYENRGLYADSTTFKIFDFTLKQGDLNTALYQPNTLVLTERFARKYFGDENPVGQSLTFDSDRELTVRAVIADPPRSSHLQFDFLASMSSYRHAQHDSPTWMQYYTYLLLNPNGSPEAVAAKLKTAFSKYMQPEEAVRFTPLLQPLADIHLKSNLHRELSPNGNMTQVWVFGSAALFILLIACVNFINLATAFAARRGKEVGVRKATGADRKRLIAQFLTESFAATLIAVLLSCPLMALLAPYFEEITGTESVFRLSNPFVPALLTGIWLITGLAAGLYPAFVLSSFRPALTLRAISSSGSKGALLRKGLIVFQFALSVFLIVASLTIFRQNSFLTNTDLGFDRQQVVVMNLRDDAMRNRLDAFKTALLEHPGVVSVSASGNLPGGSDFGIPWAPEGVDKDNIPPVRSLVIDPDYLKTFDIKIAAGRDFSSAFPSDSTAYLINETAARQLGWSNPLEKRIAMPAVGRPPAPVVGVVKDFHFHSLHEPIGPLMFFMPPSAWMSVVSVRIRPENLTATLDFLGKKWAEFDPNHPFAYEFMDETFARLYLREQRMGQLANGIAVLAIFIACLGLFGLAAHSTERRTKEIGIRKVLGASVAGITGLLAKDFLKLVVIAIAIASPIAYWAMNRWLADFAYRIELQWWMFVLAGVAAVLVAFLTVSAQSIKAALANPVKSLRSE